MVVVDSSALIPLSWVGRLDVIRSVFDEVRTTEVVREEVLTEGKRGVSRLESFLHGVAVHETPAAAVEVGSSEGIAVGDASVVLLADSTEEILLANDKGLLEVAKSYGVERYWVTTLLLKCAKEGVLDSDEANDALYDLVDAGMNLHPKVYAQVQKKLEEVGD